MISKLPKQIDCKEGFKFIIESHWQASPPCWCKTTLENINKKKTLTTNNGKVELTKKEKRKFITSINEVHKIKLKIESQRLQGQDRL